MHWRTGVLAWRDVVHEDCQRDPELAALHYHLAAEDTAYFMVMFCPIYESRATPDYEWDEDKQEWVIYLKPAGWYPWVPFHFQVEMIRWIERVKSLSQITDVTGKGDGVVEKSREMGASWIFCLVAAHDFLFGNNQDIGLVSYAEYVVDNAHDPKSLFFKIRALIGVYDKVPKTSHAPGTLWHDLPVRVPSFMAPAGYKKGEHDRVMQITHPTKNNSIIGNSTTGKTGTAARWSWGFIDEGSKNDKLLKIWGSLQAVTYHRFVGSSVDLTYGDDFYRLARDAERATTFDEPGPSFFKIPWHLHPLRDENWLESERARSNLDPYDFKREYEMDYFAGFGDWVYPYGQQMQVVPAAYVMGDGPVSGAIDPGIADPTAITLFQGIPGSGRARLFDALMLKTESAEQLAPMMMGFPPGHAEWDTCPEEGRDFMARMWDFRQRGEKVDWVGDPYGAAVGGSGSETFYAALFRASQEKSLEYPDLPACHIIVRYNYDNTARHHPGRKEALATLLPHLDINDNFGGRKFLAALQSHRYKPEDATTTERLKPEHGWGSHLVTSAEFHAVHNKAITEALRFRHKTIPGPHVPPRTNRTPQKPRIQRVA